MLKQQIQEDLKSSLRNREEIRTSTLRMLLATIVNKEIEKRTKASKELPNAKESELEEKSKLSDEELVQVLMGEAKKRRESIEMFQKGNRQDLVDQETKELQVLQNYLPEQMNEEEVRKLVQDAIAKTGATSAKDMGKVMGIVISQTKGKADGSLVSKIVKELLQS